MNIYEKLLELQNGDVTQKNVIANYIKYNPIIISDYNDSTSILELCFENLYLDTLYFFTDCIYNSKTNMYKFYRYIMYKITFVPMLYAINKSIKILEYSLSRNYFSKKIIQKNIFYYPIDKIWFTVKPYLDDIHYIYKGNTIINLCFNNIPLFDFILTDAIKKNLYDPIDNNYDYYTNNYLLSSNLEFDISEFMNKCDDFRTYILSKLPAKYKYLKNLRRVQNIIIKNNIQALEFYFNKYSKWLTPNTRLNYNWPLLDYIDSIEMFYYLINKGANINNLTIEPSSFNAIQFNSYFLTNTIYNNIGFAIEYLDIYYQKGCDFGVNKKATIQNIKSSNKLYKDIIKPYTHLRLLTYINRYKRRTDYILKNKLKSKIYGDLITKILTYI